MAISTGAPSLADMAERATALLPNLRARAAQTEQLRRTPDETLAELRQAGFFKVLQPARYNGYELPYGRSQVMLCSILGQACGSTAWVQAVVACHAWCVGMFASEAQQAVWKDSDDVLIASSFSALTGKGTPAKGGYVVSGQWQFSSGSQACSWVILGVPIEGSEPPRRLWCLLPRRDWETVDTWFAAGLRGSGSGDIRVQEAFVPEAFTLDTSLLDGRPSPGSEANPHWNYRLPLWGLFPFNVSSPALGIAHGAVNAYAEQHAGRPERATMPQRQLKLSESAAEVDAAEGLLLADCDHIERTMERGQRLSPAFLAKLQRDLSFNTLLCSRAVDRLAIAVGAHGIESDNPVNRAARDVHAVANHGANSWDTAGLAFGRTAFGLESGPHRS